MTNDDVLKAFPKSGLFSKITPEMIAGKEKVPVSNYKPTPEELDGRMMIIKHFTLGDIPEDAEGIDELSVFIMPVKVAFDGDLPAVFSDKNGFYIFQPLTLLYPVKLVEAVRDQVFTNDIGYMQIR